MTKARSVAIYGKGGIGKSTTTSNISAALADMGKRVIQIGCDPKSDSTNNLRGGRSIPTVLDAIRSGKKIEIESIVHEGFGGVICIEAGGPEPGVGCAGRGIIAAIELLRQKKVFERYDPDVVLYDVLGDVVCGGFSVPIREGVAEQVYTVTSADFMAVYAANNLFKGIQKYANSGGALFSGIIANSVALPVQREIIDDFASRTGTTIAEYVPRSDTITRSELLGQTAVEYDPDSKQADVYRSLARTLLQNEEKYVPKPLEAAELKGWAEAWSDRLLTAKNNAQSGPGARNVASTTT
ncbi:MAG: nitrogenase iron protein NifH [Methanoculleus sp.]|jgi:nitrogenase iron protein NifH|uniref:nitrogenase iron protein NifH n=1 Tax=Methanoculleus sp. TaxID=90427 RepID=UPI0026091F7F|nr:nitrogenase iron protein NifH [Methanoculleus sp.]MCK9305926.1 nitrogenase iron protein NifH [Methanoculleus sp.]MDD2254317.1 nitrogenase iron protein NifH [Methanoculleus sp.]MDD4314771.1 nitrogenase iron protein NifH [Methanoculleus sp.]MDD4471147.1 nitrogenase iron protein NifH [Methanoculleus sp.]